MGLELTTPACKARSGRIIICPDDERRRLRPPLVLSVGVRSEPLATVVNGTLVAWPVRTTVAGPAGLGSSSTTG
jgi:hypothetical protein